MDVFVEAMRGVWRPPDDNSDAPAQPNRLSVDRACEAGLAGLLWRRERCFDAANREALGDAYRIQLLEAGLHEANLEHLSIELHRQNIDAIVCKGWAVARLYSCPGMRPYGDIDLSIRPEQFPAAENLVQSLAGRAGPIDLHRGVADLADRPSDEVWRRSRVVPFANTSVRILGGEDQLRQLCLHFWRHLGCRPLWLVDVAVVVESLPGDFDWDYALRGAPSARDRVLCVIGLAQRLLGARNPFPDMARRADRLPHWLIPTVLWRWHRGMAAAPIWSLRSFRELADSIRFGVFNPLRAIQRSTWNPHRSLAAIQTSQVGIRAVEVAVRAWRALRKLGPQNARAYDIHEPRRF